ncbi:MAG TPA: class I SAM-dependent methyltransferase [Ignavibacteria bacterium]|nr:class I SAM-dependent methyltransferase [Ignavibacteria bacterium]
MKPDNREYYEKFDWERAKLDERLTEKINILVKSFPSDVIDVCDIGCGDGAITNKLNEHFDVVASDRSINALKFVETKKFCSSADNLPLKENSFDLIFSSEMIEHLPDDIFTNTIKEFKRVSSRYIYLTFPNDENVEKNFVKCPNCDFVFNKIYHLRNLNLKKIEKLFPEYEIIFQTPHGKLTKKYNKFFAKIKHTLVPSESWIPMRWTPDKRRSTMCPECNHSFEIPYKFNLLGFLIDSLNVIISPRIPYQQFVLLKKRNA